MSAVAQATSPTRYVLGFAFDDKERDKVLLIRKARPEWQKGFLNGPGGKVEPGESDHAAMVREFQEEVLLATAPGQWRPFADLSGPGWQVKCFACFAPVVSHLYTGSVYKLPKTTDEPPVLTHIDSLFRVPVIPNLRFLVPLGLYALRTPDLALGEVLPSFYYKGNGK